MALFPNGRLEVWRNIFHWCWEVNWDDQEVSVVDNPDPRGLFRLHHGTEGTLADAGSDQDIAEDTIKSSTDYKTFSIPFKRLIRPDIPADQVPKVVLQIIKGPKPGRCWLDGTKEANAQLGYQMLFAARL
ncbi:hypothetical protein BGZ65_005086 [Modicella reniformis]|uniref:Uncharacterized protein n=1 Tax=Modicella reniformis TaxID=1440133 RepID=A0A9P6IN69_9FUNG|nr:hypothetical protein BGZ65_005086 [Modicella reniformis]